MTCSDIKDRLVDYLYRELAASEHSAYQAHLAGCQACSKEVAALGGTLDQARLALRTLDEAPPPRVRASAIEAAARAAAGAAAKGVAPGAPPRASTLAPEAGAPAAARPAVSPPARRFRDWMRRPWLIPAFAAASIMVIFVIARRVVVSPEPVDLAPAQQRQEEAPAVRLDRPARPAEAPRLAAPEAAGPGAQPEGKAEPRERDDRDERLVPLVPALQSDAFRHDPYRHSQELVKELRADPARIRRLRTPRPPTADEPAALQGPSGGSAAAVPVYPGRASSAVGAASPASSAAAPPSPSPAPPPAPPSPVAAPPASRPPAARPSSGSAASPSSSSSAAAPSSLAPPPRRAAKARSKAVLDDDVLEAPVAASPPDGAAPMALRAEQAYEGARWADAARAYRELLRSFPAHPSAPVWKERLRRCEEALSR